MTARHGGFTLIEMMITLVIAAILLAIGVPSFRALIQNQRMTTTVNEFFAAVNLTRSAALERGMQVRLVPADDAGSDWTQGWIVFVDEDDDKRPDSNETVIFRHGPVPDGMQIETNFDIPPIFIGFSATGSVQMPGGQKGGTMSFQLDDVKRMLRVNFLGRTRICDPSKELTCKLNTSD